MYNTNLFSKNENKVLTILGTKKMLIADIAKEFYRGKKRPDNSRVIIGNSIRRIVTKCNNHKLKWTIKGKGIGCKGRTVWVQ